jgi:hypothetical protein
MKEQAPIQNQFRKLQVDLPPIRKENNLFWWLAGISLAVLFLAITVHYYVAYKKASSPTILNHP